VNAAPHLLLPLQAPEGLSSLAVFLSAPAPPPAGTGGPDDRSVVTVALLSVGEGLPGPFLQTFTLVTTDRCARPPGSTQLRIMHCA
jgi:hypothetical protein